MSSFPEIRPDQIKYGPFPVKGATALITGGSSGIGLALAKQFVQAGSKVIVTGRREEALKKVQSEVKGLQYIVSDVEDEAARVKLRDQVVRDFPETSMLICNAGGQRRIGLPQEKDDWHERCSEIRANLEAPAHLAWLFTPHFQEQKEAAIVFMSSGLSFWPAAMSPMYGATKAAIRHYAASSRYAYVKTNIRIVEIVPPSVVSNLGGSHDMGEPTDEFAAGVFERFVAGELEIGYKVSEAGRTAGREQQLAVGHKISMGQLNDTFYY